MPKLDKIRESSPVILNIIRDTGWCYTFGVVSVVATIPVLVFESYEIWKCRKEGWHQIMHRMFSLTGAIATSCWMVSDLFYHDHFRHYVKWIFGVSFIFLALYVIYAFRQDKQEQTTPRRMMMVSKQTRNIVFVHTKIAQLRRRPLRTQRVMMVRSKNN